MTVPAANERSLTRLIGRVGLRYFQRLLPPTWLALGLLTGATLWMVASTQDLVAFTACALVFTGLLLHWPRRREGRLPWWRLLALAAVVSLEGAPTLAAEPLVRNLLYALSALCLVQSLRHLVAGWSTSRRLQRSATTLDDEHLLALLPPDAREDARRWQRGDDSKSAELGQVVELAALWLAMNATGTCAAQSPARRTM